MKKLSVGLVINIITWAVILAAVLSAAHVFNKLIAAQSMPVIYPAQNPAEESQNPYNSSP